MLDKDNIAVVGGGLIGLATAYELLEKQPNLKVHLFEKEKQLGMHQSGRNSGVLHCGLYYLPGSLKSKMAVEGIQKMTAFCRKYDIPHEICGKILVATSEEEKKTLRNLAERGKQNGLKGLQLLNPQEIRKREPHVNGIEALLVPEEGIVDYKAVMNKLVELILEKGGKVNYGIDGQEIELENYHAQIFCCGLQSDRVFKSKTQKNPGMRIIPFRGEYLKIKEDYHDIVKHLIYPVPDSRYPFLGVHFTRMIDGGREVGPNAVISWKREGYQRGDFVMKDAWDTLSYSGFRKFVAKNLKFSLGEWKSSLSMNIFLKKAQKMIPEIQLEMLERGNAGVRAQSMLSSGQLDMDFNIQNSGNQIHVLNAPSPGATACFSIADYLLKKCDFKTF